MSCWPGCRPSTRRRRRSTTITTKTETTGTQTTTTTGTGEANSNTTITDTKKGEEINLDDELGKDVRPNWSTDEKAKLGGYTVDKVEPAEDGNSKTLTLKKTSPTETKEMAAEDVAKLLDVPEDGVEKKVVFSGDIGNHNQPIIRDPSLIDGADYVVMESTYGDRNHDPVVSYTAELAKIIDDTFSKGGNVIIPSFAVGRTQELLYFMREMKKEGLVKSNPDFTVCVDSPLANEATKIFSGDLRGYLDDDALEVVKDGERLFTFPGLTMTESSEESKMLNMDKSSKVIISASGMCDAGRIRHHLKHNLWREECAIVFVGYQGEGTLGRHLLEGAKQVRLFGEDIAVNASIYNFKGLSSHADRDHLIKWIEHIQEPTPQQIFVVHGDAPVTEIFANTLREKGLPAHAPLYEEVFDLSKNVMLAAGVELLPKKTSYASNGHPASAYHEVELAAMDLFSIIRASKGSSNKDLKKMAAQIRTLTEKFKA